MSGYPALSFLFSAMDEKKSKMGTISSNFGLQNHHTLLVL